MEVPVEGLLHGAVSLERGAAGWVRPLRFFPSQLRALGSCAAWHPSLYRAQARTTSGVVVEFETDASECALQIDVDPEPRTTTAQIELAAGGPTDDPFDGVSATVDGRPVAPCMPPEGPVELVVDLAGEDGEPTLPGFDPRRRVRIHLPALRGCTVGSVLCDGTYVDPVAPRPTLLVLGDSISQGFLAGDPACTWPALVAADKGLDLVNQGVGGLVFQPTALMGLGALEAPDTVWVALGPNYRFEGWSGTVVAREVAAYIDTVCALWPEARIFCATPTPHDEDAYPTARGAAYGTVPGLIADACARHPEATLVDGLELLEDRARYFADADHPSARGARLMALRIGRVMAGEPPIDTMAAKKARRAAREALTAREEGPGPCDLPPEGTEPIDLAALAPAVPCHLEPLAPASVGDGPGGSVAVAGSGEEEVVVEERAVDERVDVDVEEAAGATDGTVGADGAPEGADAVVPGAPTLGRDLEDRFNALCGSLPGLDAEGRAAGQAYLAGTHALYHGSPLSWAFTPKLFTAEGECLLADAAETMYRIMVKTLAAFRSDPAVRAAFGLPADVERLCLIEDHFPCPVPVARVDVFLNEDTGEYWFCELNCDGSAGMTATDEVSRAVALSPTFSALEAERPGLEPFSVVDACTREVLDCYGAWDRAGTGPFPAERPALAVVDYLESLSRDEAEDFVGRFAALGVDARITDIRDLTVDEVDGVWRLVDGRGPVDCVWRRVVVSEMMGKPCDGADALVLAAEENLACVVGGFSTWPCATKNVFAFFHGPGAASVLDAGELDFVRAHVPFTKVLAPGDDLAPYLDREAWIVKPADGYNADSVVAGQDVDDARWLEVLERGCETGAVVQAYAPQYVCPVVVGGCAPEDVTQLSGVVKASCMEGLYLFGGRFSGVFTRCGTGATIGEWTSRLNMGCFVDRGGRP